MLIDSLPSTYLGLPLFLGGNLGGFWDSLISKFRNKLASWKGKWLSSAGRLVMIKSVLSGLPIFWLGFLWIPVKVKHQLECLM